MLMQLLKCVTKLRNNADSNESNKILSSKIKILHRIEPEKLRERIVIFEHVIPTFKNYAHERVK